MVKTFFALALLAMSGSALAYQEQAARIDESGEVSATVRGTGAAGQPLGDMLAPPEADEAAGADAGLEENYRSAARSYRRCRLNARSEGAGVAGGGACMSQRKRMMAAKEALKEAK